MSPVLRTVAPGGPLFRVGRGPDVWTLASWIYAGPDGTFGNRYDDPAGEYRVLYAAGQRRGAFLETLDDLDAGDLRRRAPRALTQEISRFVFEHGSAPSGEPVAGIAYRSRLGDELTNWAIFEGHQLDEIVKADAMIAADDPDLVAALEILGLTLASTV